MLYACPIGTYPRVYYRVYITCQSIDNYWVPISCTYHNTTVKMGVRTVQQGCCCWRLRCGRRRRRRPRLGWLPPGPPRAGGGRRRGGGRLPAASIAAAGTASSCLLPASVAHPQTLCGLGATAHAAAARTVANAQHCRSRCCLRGLCLRGLRLRVAEPSRQPVEHAKA
jgi:hypothetical protein